jgi:hypothetical protein
LAESSQSSKDWFQSHAPLEFRNRIYYKNSPPRRFRTEEVALVGQFGATPIFIDAGAPPDEAAIIYVLQDATCLFQPYYGM